MINQKYYVGNIDLCRFSNCNLGVTALLLPIAMIFVTTVVICKLHKDVMHLVAQEDHINKV